MSRKSSGARPRPHLSDSRTREAHSASEAQPTDVLCGAVASDSQPSVGPTDTTIVAGFRLAEYNTVRTEWLASRDAQQSTLQWTLAALSVLLAATVGTSLRTGQPVVYIGLAGVIVAAATFSQAIWFGEVMRMERAALYLRGFELALSDEFTDASSLPPLLWERWRGYVKKTHDPDSGPAPLWVAKAAPSIIGSFALYGLISVAGLAILVVAAADTTIPHHDRIFAIVMVIVAAVLYFGATAYLGREALRIKDVSDKPALLDTFVAEATNIESQADS